MKRFFYLQRALLACVLLASLLAAPAFAASSDEREVVVTGIGRTEDEAKIQAYRSAIRNVIGSMVVSNVLVENELLIRDQVLSHSDGFVTKANQIGETRNLGDGLLEVTMQITVKSQQLQQKLQAEKITITAIDGQSLFAQKVTQDESKNDAASIIAEKVANLPAGVLVANADISASQQKSTPGMVQLTLPVSVSVDNQAYSTFIKDLNATMTNLGFKATPITSSQNHDKYVVRADSGLFFKTATGKYPNEIESLYLVGLCDLVNKQAQTSRWKLYSVPQEVVETLAKGVHNFTLSVELRDASGQAITTSEISYVRNANHKIWNGGYSLLSNFPSSVIAAKYSDDARYSSHVAIAPQVILNSEGYFAAFPAQEDELVFNIQFDMTEEELKSIQSVHCIITNIKNER